MGPSRCASLPHHVWQPTHQVTNLWDSQAAHPPNTGVQTEKTTKKKKTNMFLLVLLRFVFAFPWFFLVFHMMFHKGRISKNTPQISLTPKKIIPLSIFSVWTPDLDSSRRKKTAYAQNLIVARFVRVNSNMLTSKFWFSHGLISNILV